MSTTVQVLTLLKGLQQNQWLSEDSKTQVVKVQNNGWFFGRNGKDGELIQKTVYAALEALKAKDGDIAKAMCGVEAALERRQSRALNHGFTDEHTLFYNLKLKVHDAMQGVIIPSGSSEVSPPPPLRKVKLNKVISGAAKLCFNPNGGEGTANLLYQLRLRPQEPVHTPSPELEKLLAKPLVPLRAKPPSSAFIGGPRPSQEMLLAAMKKMGVGTNGDDDTPFENECARLSAMEV